MLYKVDTGFYAKSKHNIDWSKKRDTDIIRVDNIPRYWSYTGNNKNRIEMPTLEYIKWLEEKLAEKLV